MNWNITENNMTAHFSDNSGVTGAFTEMISEKKAGKKKDNSKEDDFEFKIDKPWEEGTDEEEGEDEEKVEEGEKGVNPFAKKDDDEKEDDDENKNESVNSAFANMIKG